MKCSLHSDRCGEGDGVSVLSICSCGQRGGDDVAGSVADKNKKVVTWST